MKRTLIAFGLGVLVGGFGFPAVAQEAEPRRAAAVPITAAAWLIADSTSGFVLDSANATKKLQIGSITKVATAMVVMDWAAAKNADLGQFAVVPGTVTKLSSPNSIGLQPGNEITLRDALYAALMQSDNQAAETLAFHVGRELGGGPSDREAVDLFVSQMNALGRKLGMRDTRFLNAHGLDDLENKLPYSTAGDVGKLINYALGQNGFTFYTSQKERRISWRVAGGEPVNHVLRNTNEALGLDNIDGVKTGNTRKAGPCVVLSAAQRPESKQVGENHVITPRRLTVVVLGSGNRFEVGRALLTRGWGLLDQWAAAGRPTKGWRGAGEGQ